MKVVILAAGDFPTHPIPLKALREADFVVCCDSAYSSYIPLSQPQAAASSPILGEQPECGSSSSPKIGEVAVRRTDGGVCKPFVVIGDGDSLSEQDKRQLGDRWIHVPEQDYNDLHKAMQWVMSGQWSVVSSQYDCVSQLDTDHQPLITILGATGKREDHTLGNISYLVTFTEEHPGIHLEMLTDHGRFLALTPDPELHTAHYTLHTFRGQQISLFTPDPSTAIMSEGLRWPLDNFRPRLWWQATLNEALADTFSLTITGPVILFQTYEPKN